MNQVQWGRPGCPPCNGNCNQGRECPAIKTEASDHDDTKHSTEAGGMFAVTLFVVFIFGLMFGAWLFNTIAAAVPK